MFVVLKESAFDNRVLQGWLGAAVKRAALLVPGFPLKGPGGRSCRYGRQPWRPGNRWPGGVLARGKENNVVNPSCNFVYVS